MDRSCNPPVPADVGDVDGECAWGEGQMLRLVPQKGHSQVPRVVWPMPQMADVRRGPGLSSPPGGLRWGTEQSNGLSLLPEHVDCTSASLPLCLLLPLPSVCSFHGPHLNGRTIFMVLRLETWMSS